MAPSYFEYSYAVDDGIASAFISLLSGLPYGLLTVAGYVLTSLALYTLAKRRGINHPWLSWVPVVNCWIIGSLSDQYRYVVKGEEKSKRKILLVLNMISFLIGLAIIVLAIGAIFGIIDNSMYGAYPGDDMLEEVLAPLLGVLGLSLPLAGISIAIVVIRYMALYDIYTSMDPGNNVLFLVLSIIFGVTEPFFLFFNRNKDLGMPPRRQEHYEAPPQEPQWQPPQPPEEPWENKDYL